MKQILNRCKACGAITSYDIAGSAVGCPFCHTAEPLNLDRGFPKKNEYSNNSNFLPFKELLQIYKCTNCGCVYESKDERSNNCPSCGSGNFLITSTLNSVPDAILPFLLSKSVASKHFKKWTRRKWFAPHDLKKVASLDSAEPIYYPLFVLDAENRFDYSGVGIINRTDSKGNSTTKRSPFSDSLNTSIRSMLIPATDKISAGAINSLAPFKLSCTTKFDKRYLYGFSACPTTISANDCYQKAKEQIQRQNIAEATSNKRLVYDNILNLTGTTTLSSPAFALCYAPLWKASYTYKQKKYNCYINGTTGKTAGVAPLSKLKVGLFTLGLVALIAGIVLLITHFS